MTRRARTGVAILACTLLLAAAVAEAQQASWKAALFGPPRAVTMPLDWFARQVSAKTGGQVKIELVYGEALAKATEMPDGLRAGAFEIGFLCASYYPGKFPLWTVLDLPMFTPDDITVQGRLQMAVAEHPAVLDEFKRWNVKLLVPVPLPQYQIMGKRRIARVEDFKGVRIRVSGLMAQVLEEYGAVKSLVPAPEVFPSLERGVVDAVTFPSTYTFVSYRIHEISKYFIDKISLGTQPCFYGASQSAWNKLSPQQQKVMLELREGTLAEFVKAYRTADEKNYVDFKTRGLEIINFPPAERAKLAANAEKFWKAWVEDMQKKGLRGKEVFEFTQATMKELGKK